MATLDEARRAFDNYMDGRFEPIRPRRVVYMGDGRGYAASNLVPPDAPTQVYVRNKLSSKEGYPVRLNRNVRPAFNIPVVVERRGAAESIIDIDPTFMDRFPGASQLGGTAPHGQQHEFGGGDEVFIDSRLLKPGLARPTDPPSMRVEVLPFVYYGDTWQRFQKASTIDFSAYRPTAPARRRFVLISVDPEVNDLVYTIGKQVSANVPWDQLLTSSDGFVDIPEPAGADIPIAAVLIQSSTTEINWDEDGTNNLFSLRMFLSQPQRHLSERIDQLEGYVGFKSSLTRLGAEDTSSDEFYVDIDGGTFS